MKFSLSRFVHWIRSALAILFLTAAAVFFDNPFLFEIGYFPPNSNPC